MSRPKQTLEGRDVDAYEWCWWAVDTRDRVACFDASPGGMLPSSLGHSMYSQRRLERAELGRSMLELGGALLPRLSFEASFAHAPASSRVYDPAELAARPTEPMDCLLELTDAGPLCSREWLDELCAAVEGARLRRLSWSPVFCWLRAPPQWLAAHWARLGVSRALLPFALTPTELGAFEYVYDPARELYCCTRGPRSSVLRFGQLPVSAHSQFDGLDTEFCAGGTWAAPTSTTSWGRARYLSREDFARHFPNMWT